MRQIIIDTETTGLDPGQGHRVIELAALEIIDRRLTGRAVQLRFDPEREIDPGATEVHGRPDLHGGAGCSARLRPTPSRGQVAIVSSAHIGGIHHRL